METIVKKFKKEQKYDFKENFFIFYFIIVVSHTYGDDS